MNAKKAFTLIELLVVIAIIAILAAILFPVFAQAKEAAKKTVALSNQKQIVLGTMMYQNDADDFLPPAKSYDSAVGSNNQGFAFLLSPYIQKVSNTSGGDANPNSKNTLWHDPSDSIAAAIYPGELGNTANLAHQSFVPVFWTSGGIDRAAWFTIVTVGTFSSIPGKSSSQFPAPADTFILGETANPASIIGSNFSGIKRPWDPAPSTYSGSAGASTGGQYGGQDCTSPVDPGASTACTTVIDKTKPASFHTDGWVYGYEDGHAKFLKAIATLGKGIGTTGMDKDGHVCNVFWPCGPWTLDDQD